MQIQHQNMWMPLKPDLLHLYQNQHPDLLMFPWDFSYSVFESLLLEFSFLGLSFWRSEHSTIKCIGFLQLKQTVDPSFFSLELDPLASLFIQGKSFFMFKYWSLLNNNAISSSSYPSTRSSSRVSYLDFTAWRALTDFLFHLQNRLTLLGWIIP